MSLAEDDNVIKAFPPHRSDQPLRPEATPAQPGDGVFRGSVAMSDRLGGVCHGALLGA
jgi:hypothetical protein